MKTATPTMPRARRSGPARSSSAPAASWLRGGNARLYRGSFWLFLAFAASVIAAFWPTYVIRIRSFATYHAHAHGAAMALWCALLVAQAWLIRAGRRATHARLGKTSYVLVPLIIATTVNFVHFRTRGVGAIDVGWLYALALILNGVAAFTVLYALAMYHRSVPATHARYMICTMFPLVPPVTDRLIFVQAPSLVPLFPVIGRDPVVPIFGFALVDLMLVALAAWDWRANRRADAFLVALAILLAYHASVLTFHRLPAWAAFAEWFSRLPLS